MPRSWLSKSSGDEILIGSRCLTAQREDRLLFEVAARSAARSLDTYSNILFVKDSRCYSRLDGFPG